MKRAEKASVPLFPVTMGVYVDPGAKAPVIQLETDTKKVARGKIADLAIEGISIYWPGLWETE